MDVLSFNDLYDSLRRNEAAQLMRDTRLASIITHDPKLLEDDWNLWAEILQISPAKETKTAADFVAEFGSGF